MQDGAALNGRFLLSLALDNDSSGQKQDALKQYMRAAEKLLTEPTQLIDQMVVEEDFIVRNEWSEQAKQSLTLVGQCLGRAAELVEELNRLQDRTNFTSSIPIPAALSNSSSTSLSKSSSRLGSSSSIGAQSPSSLTRAASPPASAIRLPKPTGSVYADLSAVRRHHERINLSKVVARQKQQTQTTAAAAHTQRQSSFIDVQFISDLISRRHAISTQVNDRVLSLFESVGLSLGSASALSVNDNIWKRVVKLSLSQLGRDVITLAPVNSIVALLSHQSHSVAKLAIDFAARMRYNLTNAIETANEGLVMKVIEEYHQFCHQLRRYLLEHYGALSSSSDEMMHLETAVQISIEHYYFGGSVGGGPVSLAATVFKALRMTQNRSDQLLNARMIDLGWRNDEQLIELFGIEEKFRLLLVDAPNTSLEDGCITRSKFSAAIDQLRMLPVSRTPTAKAAVLMKVCELICQAADGQGKQQCSESSM